MGHNKIDSVNVSPSSPNLYPGLTYVGTRSPLEQHHPLIKLIFLVSFSITAWALDSLSGQGILLGLLIASYALARLGPALLIRKLRFVFAFGFFIFLIQALALKGGILLARVSLGPISITLWSKGFLSGLRIMFRFINVIGSSYLFVTTTDPNRLAYALMQAGLPYRLGFALITALRFIPVFHLELEQIKNAQQAKGIDLEGLSPRQLLRAVRYLLLPLVISALGRVDSLTISMEGRAFGLYPSRTYLTTQPLTPKDKITLAAIPLCFIGFYFFF
mgnify:CR=1 FL=1